GFSHNTLQQHLERSTAKGLVVREKVSASGFGRPKFAYHVPFCALSNSSTPENWKSLIKKASKTKLQN
ncbi:MAG TPA: hypothetical protein VLU95_00855, partial [Candidatus Acidoferrum sp.]|nr:hypothetical protein [Candidatus Acidoferrum sp.]